MTSSSNTNSNINNSHDYNENEGIIWKNQLNILKIQVKKIQKN
jgi:hypothetical protein